MGDDTSILILNNGNYSSAKNRFILSVIFGFVVGFCLGYNFIILNSNNFTFNYKPIKFTYSEENYQNDNLLINSSDHKHSGENTTLADIIYNEVRVLCWVLTMPENHKSRAEDVKNTWGRRCNKIIFISTEDDEELGAIGLNITESRDILWQKTRFAFTHIYENYFDDYDWFLKADDDTYMIMENLRYMLSFHSPETPIYFGYKYQLTGVVYMSGGPGYVLSKEAVRRLVEIAFKNPRICRKGNEASTEDLEMGVCLTAVGVLAGDSRDEDGKSRFHALSLDFHLKPNITKDDFWLWTNNYYDSGGFEDVSDKGISFHYVTQTEMFVCEYLIYHVQPYGIWSIPEEIPKAKFTYDEELKLLQNAEKDRNLKFDYNGP